jgi:hypothetical protein
MSSDRHDTPSITKDHPSLPLAAQIALQRWRESIVTDGLPFMEEFAPFRIPAAQLPFTMVYRRVAPRELVYGVVGDELTFLFRENPVGTPVLAYADAAERAARYDVILGSIDSRRPFWFSGSVLFKECRINFGRLGLPLRGRAHDSLVIIYFPSEPLPYPRPTPVGSNGLQLLDFHWL